MSAKKTKTNYDKLERVFHERHRLEILTTLLISGGSATFNELKNKCDLTDGNLKSHLQYLETEKIVSSKREFPGDSRPLTTVSISATGRNRFMNYLDHLQGVVQNACKYEKQIKIDSRRTKPKLA